MKVLLGLIAGIVATAAMTFFLDMVSFITGANLKVVKILGTMVTMETSPEGFVSESEKALAWGYGLHYLIGIGFASGFLYAMLKSPKIGLDMQSAFWFGILTGVIGTVVWRVFFGLHPYPPEIDLQLFLFNIFLGHIVFSFAVVISKKFILYFLT